MLFYAAGNLAMKIGTTPLLQRFGFRQIVLVNGGIVTLSLVACGLLGPRTPAVAIAAVLFAAGLCRSMQYTSINTLGFVDVPPPLMSSASTLSATITQLAAAAGIAIAALLLHVTDFRGAFMLSAALALVATLSFVSLPRNAGADVTASGPRTA